MTLKTWKKTTSKSCLLKQKFSCFRDFSFTAQQPKWQNSCSRMWPIEQLYIELGCSVSILKALRYIGKQLIDRGVSRKILTYSSKKIGKHLTDRGVSRQCPRYSSKNSILANMSIKKKYDNSRKLSWVYS